MGEISLDFQNITQIAFDRDRNSLGKSVKIQFQELKVSI